MSEAEVIRTASNVVTSENLADFHAEKLGLASEEAPVVAEAVEETPDSEPAVEAQAESEPTAEEEAEVTDKPKQNPKLEKRFSELTKRAKQAEAEKQALEARLQELEAKVAPAPQQIEQDILGEKPQASQFQDAFEYAEALAEWSAEKALVERDKQEQQRKIEEERTKVIQSWTQKLEKAKAELPDFDEMVASSQVQVRDEVRDAILESDVGPQILYQLASDDELAQRISSLPVNKALKELGKLEVQFERKEAPAEKSEPVARSKAPAPIKPLTAGKGTQDVLIDGDGQFHGTYAQWKAARQAKRIR
jgi:transcriptional regulator NrdR family protein